jgi:hypothetical protein
MDTTRGIGGWIGAIVWIMIGDFAGGIAGLAAGWLAMSLAEPMMGDLAGSVLLVTVPLGLCAGALLGVTSLGWFAGWNVLDARTALTGR